MRDIMTALQVCVPFLFACRPVLLRRQKHELVKTRVRDSGGRGELAYHAAGAEEGPAVAGVEDLPSHHADGMAAMDLWRAKRTCPERPATSTYDCHPWGQSGRSV